MPKIFGAGSESQPGSTYVSYSLTFRRAARGITAHGVCLRNTAAQFAIQHCIVPDCKVGESNMIVYRELTSLEQDLGISAETLYAVSNSLSHHYRTVKITKKSGGYRTLSVPDEILKRIQCQIAAVLLVHMPVSRYATAYRFGSTTVKNAQPHVGKPLVLKLDILHFFDSIRYSAVKDMVFPASIYAENIRILIAMLCYRKDSLPQGAPTSPAISNILMYEFDGTIGS